MSCVSIKSKTQRSFGTVVCDSKVIAVTHWWGILFVSVSKTEIQISVQSNYRCLNAKQIIDIGWQNDYMYYDMI